MNHYVGIDVSLQGVCIVDGRPVRADRLAKPVLGGEPAAAPRRLKPLCRDV
jgi:hypothetical protein